MKTPLLWILLLVNALLVFGAVSSDNITIGGGVGSVFKNAPHVVQSFYGVMSILGLLMVTAFMQGTAGRDFNFQMDAFVFSSPIKKRDYYFGKFIGAYFIALIPLLGISIGALLGPLMPWVQPERYGDVVWSGHIGGIIAFVIPNTFIAGVWLYAIAIIFRSNLISWVGAMLILVLTEVSSGLLSDLDNEWLAAMLDPFGTSAQSLVGKYLTVDEKNLGPVPFTGVFVQNRLLWMAVSLIVLFFVYTRFSFSSGNALFKKKKEEEEIAPVKAHDNKIYQPQHRSGFSLASFINLLVFETKAVIKNPTFIILVAIGVINLITGLVFFTEGYGLKKYPVTYDLIDTIRGSFYLFLIGVIIFFSGVLVWRDRDAKIHEIKDATPSSSGLTFAAKLLGMLVAVFIIQLSTIGIGVVTQVVMGFTVFKLDVYAISLLLLDMLQFTYMIVMALLLHYLINNRYIAYFAFVLFMIVNAFLWSVLEIGTNMVNYGETPRLVFSDMNRFGPYMDGTFWFNLYWSLFALILCFIAYGFFTRGNETTFGLRLGYFKQRMAKVKMPLIIVTVLWAAVGVWVYYNTLVINTYDNSEEREQKQKEYELTYKKFEGILQPTYFHFDYDLDLRPYDRDLIAKVTGYATNAGNVPIPELHFSMPSFSDSVLIEIDGARLTLRDNRLEYRIFSLDKPLAPGDTIVINFTNYVITKGFENEVSNTSITDNGSFFNKGDLVPNFGYFKYYEIADKNKRKKLGLPVRMKMPLLDEADSAARAVNYIGGSWVTMKARISTAGDQIAVAPGSLKKQYTLDGKNVFEYELDHKSLNFFSFISARYEVAREKWNDVDIEVYYIPEHAFNVPNMLASVRKSLEYFTANFGTYYHKQARIIEFPRYASFAQAFAGTMPYSESIGFITDLRKVTEDDIDMVYYVVAHEMGHQWWAHQVVGANMRGTEMLSETFAQYSALMVMEKEYGRDKMKKFLKHEMNSYLRGRGTEFEAERPIIETEQQGYIHYRKGSLVMYYLKEMIGEDSVNAALRRLIDNHAYQPAPYPTSLTALREFRAVTPDSLQYVIDDLFENITLFSNLVKEAKYEAAENGYVVTIETSSEKFRSDSLGKETAVPMNDFIDIAVFGEPANGAKLGKVLYSERRKIDQKDNTFKVRVEEKPAHAGIDPYNYLIDRIADDNVKKVSGE